MSHLLACLLAGLLSICRDKCCDKEEGVAVWVNVWWVGEDLVAGDVQQQTTDGKLHCFGFFCAQLGLVCYIFSLLLLLLLLLLLPFSQAGWICARWYVIQQREPNPTQPNQVHTPTIHHPLEETHYDSVVVVVVSSIYNTTQFHLS